MQKQLTFFTFIIEIHQYKRCSFFRLTWRLRLMQLRELHQSNLSILALFMMLISFNAAREMISPALNPAYLAMICLLFHQTAEIAASGNSIRPELLQKPEMWAATLRSGTTLHSALVFKTEMAKQRQRLPDNSLKKPLLCFEWISDVICDQEDLTASLENKPENPRGSEKKKKGSLLALHDGVC